MKDTMQEIHSHLREYPYTQIIRFLILFLILGIGLGFFVLYQGQPSGQFFVVAGISFSYFLWGVLYHLVEGDLHPRIVVEYLLMSLLSLILARGALFSRL